MSVEIDEERLQEMLVLVGPASERRLLQMLISDLQVAHSALEGAIERKNAGLMRDQIHVLASLAGTFGGVALTGATRELEGRSLSGPGLPDSSGVLRRTEQLIAALSARLAGGPR